MSQTEEHLERLTKIILAILFIAAAASAWSQQSPTISTRTNIVTLYATVHDADGKVVKNLTQDDFTLLEDGVPQKINYFSPESDLPLTIGLLVDTSRSQIEVLEEERSASYTFLDQVLREGEDQAFIASFDKRVAIAERLSSSRSVLQSELTQLKVPTEYGTLLYSAIKDSSEDVMKNLPGRKAVIALTDGVAFKDPTPIGVAIEYAQRADTIIYSIRYSDPTQVFLPIVGAIIAVAKERGKKGLHRMAEDTGGVTYEVTKGQSIEAIYAEIEDALRNQYSIGYTPPRLEGDDKYHNIKLTANDRHLVANARAGYYSK
jgi:VWFA-related protein